MLRSWKRGVSRQHKQPRSTVHKLTEIQSTEFKVAMRAGAYSMKRLYMLGLAAVIVSILCVIRMYSVFSGQYTFSRQISKDIRIPYKPIIDPADVSTLMSNLATMDRPYHTWNESEMLLRKGGTTMATSLLRELESLNGTHPWHCFVLHNGQIYSTEATAHSYNLMSSYQIDRGMDVLQGLSTMISLGNAV